MMKVMLLLIASATPLYLGAQQYTSHHSEVTFFSEAPVKNIEAKNTKASSLFDSVSGEISFQIPIRDFEFDKSLMKEHFNEKYLESETFPNATFLGKITGYSMSNSRVQAVEAHGKLNIHGEVKEVNVPGTLEVKGLTIQMKSTFVVELADYKINIPKLIWRNMTERVEVKLNFQYGHYKR